MKGGGGGTPHVHGMRKTWPSLTFVADQKIQRGRSDSPKLEKERGESETEWGRKRGTTAITENKKTVQARGDTS